MSVLYHPHRTGPEGVAAVVKSVNSLLQNQTGGGDATNEISAQHFQLRNLRSIRALVGGAVGVLRRVCVCGILCVCVHAY